MRYPHCMKVFESVGTVEVRRDIINVQRNHPASEDICQDCIVKPLCSKLCDKFKKGFYPVLVEGILTDSIGMSIQDLKKWWFKTTRDYYVSWFDL